MNQTCWACGQSRPLPDEKANQADRAVGAQQLPWDSQKVAQAIGAVNDPEIRSLFQDVLVKPEKGRQLLSILAVMLHFIDAEIVTERERHERNVMARILALCGYTANADMFGMLLDEGMPYVLSAHQTGLEQAGLAPDPLNPKPEGEHDAEDLET